MDNADNAIRDKSGRRLVVDRTLCEGHAICEVVAPMVFEVGDDDQTHLLVSRLENDAIAAAENAVSECPRGALSWLQESEPVSYTGWSLEAEPSGETP